MTTANELIGALERFRDEHGDAPVTANGTFFEPLVPLEILVLPETFDFGVAAALNFVFSDDETEGKNEN